MKHVCYGAAHSKPPSSSVEALRTRFFPDSPPGGV